MPPNLPQFNFATNVTSVGGSWPGGKSQRHKSNLRTVNTLRWHGRKELLQFNFDESHWNNIPSVCAWWFANFHLFDPLQLQKVKHCVEDVSYTLSANPIPPTIRCGDSNIDIYRRKTALSGELWSFFASPASSWAPRTLNNNVVISGSLQANTIEC